MRPKLVVWGASGHALVVIDILRLAGEYEIVGLLDDVNPQSRGLRVAGLAVLGGVEQLDELRRNGTTHVILAFGNCGARLRLAQLAKRAGFRCASAIHPRAVVAESARVGPGTVVAACAVINPGATIGENAIVNTSATVDHDCSIADGVHLSPGAHLGGYVTVGEEAWVGIGATVRDRIHIGAHSIIGAGAVLTRDVPPCVVVYGVPGRVIRSVNEQNNLGEVSSV
ncbi:MAG: acetyltransferase [Limisphaerales bacterium]